MDRKYELYTSLVDSLDNLVKTYRVLLDLVRKERDILVSVNMDELNENNRAKELTVGKIKMLEQTRAKIARDLSKETNGNVDFPRLSELASAFNGEDGDRLRNLQSVLDLLLKRVAEINKDNEVLVANALQTVNGAMNAIKDTLQEKPTYQKHGGLASVGQGAAGQIVSREI